MPPLHHRPCAAPRQQEGAGGYLLDWYALHVASNHERKVRDRLQFQLIEELTPFWIPDPKRISRFTKNPVEHSLFPGYVFARFDAANRAPVLRIPGVIQILSINREPAVIAAADIEHIKILVGNPALLRPELSAPTFMEGDYVEVIHGPLTGLQGQVTMVQTRMRVLVWINTLKSGVSAEVKARDLTRIRKIA